MRCADCGSVRLGPAALRRAAPVIAALLLFLLGVPRVQAQWPPLVFRLTPTYHDGQITYDLLFISRLEGAMTDITINVPLPPGTRFVEATAQPSTRTSFDGREVQFFTAALPRNKSVRVASFTVDVTDPEQTVFTTNAWLTWKGDLPGDFTSRDATIDISKPPLDWERPLFTRLQLNLGATVQGNTVTYHIYPANFGGRMWDVAVKFPVPEGGTLVSVEAAPPFTSDFDGREVTFFASELPRRTDVGPLNVTVTAGTAELLSAYAWAAWKNVGYAVGRTTPFQEQVRTGNLLAQPGAVQRVVADPLGDVPFAAYDVTSVALSHTGVALVATFYTDAPPGPVGNPLTFVLSLYADCGTRPTEQMIYNHINGKALFRSWNSEEGAWNKATPVEVTGLEGRSVTVSVPLDLFTQPQHSRDFCWRTFVSNRDTTYITRPPGDTTLSPNEPRLTHYTALSATQVITPVVPLTPTVPLPTPVLPPEPPAEPAGLLAVPLDNGGGQYDVHLFSVPDGRVVQTIPFARQPDFHPSGAALLVNGEGGGQENVAEVSWGDGSRRPVGDYAGDAQPFYDPAGNRLVVSNPTLLNGSRLLVQCGLIPPHQEVDRRCREIANLGMLVSAGGGDLQGSHPVWTADDRIVYNGCNSWAGSRVCGIYAVPAVSTKGDSDGLTPTPLTRHPRDLPSDTHGRRVAFTSDRDGNWEAYLLNLDTRQVTNVSNSPASRDGLPTFSPDGRWLVFVSDRGGVWAVWTVPVDGGPAQKWFNLPAAEPWGEGARAWINERISWGPSQP